MAAIWMSVLIMAVGIIFVAAIVVAKHLASDSKVKVEDRTVLVLNLGGTIVDRDESRDVLKELAGQGEETISLESLISALEHASTDDHIAGLYLKCYGVDAGLAQVDAITNALMRFKESGKWIAAYSDNYLQTDYIIASLADSLYLNPHGAVDLHGLQATTLYFKDLLDKIGVEAQVVKVGTYKSAVEPFMLSGMSEASRHQQEVYLNNIWSHLTHKIAAARDLTAEKVNAAADSLPAFLPATELVEMGLVDRLVYEREVDPLLYKMVGNKDSKLFDRRGPNYVDLIEYSANFDNDRFGDGGEETIALVYAVGDITESDKGGIASERLVPIILDIADDDDIDGLILRVNSGGGSAYASEQIWDALRYFKEKTGKPFFVSMGDYAASGGYYISCGADKIYADPVTLTGSIGIFGIIPSAEGLINDKIGIHTGTVSTNPKGEQPTLFKDMTPRQRQAMQRYVDNGYELFTSRVAEGRSLSVDSVKAIAEGRVWDGKSAFEIGLVDELGDLNAALEGMASELITTGYKIKVYPDVDRKWWEQILDLDTQLSERAIATRFPLALPLYNSIESLGRLSPLQCRMDYVIIQ